MEDNKEGVNVEITVPQNGWGVEFEDNNQDDFYLDGSVNSEPLVERVIDTVDTIDTENGDESLDVEDFNKDNPIYFIAKQAMADGYLPNDLEIPKDAGIDFIYTKYKETVQPVIEKRIFEEVEGNLKKLGINEKNIFLLRALENGGSIEDVSEVSKYNKYANMDAYSTEESEKLKVIKDWYNNRGLTDKEQRRNLDAIEMDDEIESEFEEAQNFFKGIVSKYNEEQELITLQKKEAEEAAQQRNLDIVNNLSTNGKIGDEVLSKEDAALLVKALYEKSPFTFNNAQYELSPYEQFFIALNNDFEFGLKVFKDYLLSDRKKDTIKKQVRQEVEEDWLTAYKKAQSLSSSTTSYMRKNTNGNSVNTKSTNTGGVIIEL